MHELGIASDILSIALSEAQKHGARAIDRVTIRVGVLRGIVPGHLSFLFGEVARGTIAAGAVLDVEEEPVRVICGTCGTSETRQWSFECPACNAPCGRVEGGDSLRIVSLDIDA